MPVGVGIVSRCTLGYMGMGYARHRGNFRLV
jgi:hypothetical protein